MIDATSEWIGLIVAATFGADPEFVSACAAVAVITEPIRPANNNAELAVVTALIRMARVRRERMERYSVWAESIIFSDCYFITTSVCYNITLYWSRNVAK
jgi:hypothetical protein